MSLSDLKLSVVVFDQHAPTDMPTLDAPFAPGALALFPVPPVLPVLPDALALLLPVLPDVPVPAFAPVVPLDPVDPFAPVPPLAPLADGEEQVGIDAAPSTAAAKPVLEEDLTDKLFPM